MIIEANGGRVFCDVAGTGPALLVPGYASTDRFRKTAEVFADEFKVIAFDVRGEGLQDDFPAEPYSLDDLADDCAGVLDGLGVERAHYLGHSHTGMLGQAFALRHPQRVDRLVLTMTSAGGDRHGDSDQERHDLPVQQGEFTNALIAADGGDPDGVRRLGALMLSEAGARDERLLDETTEFFVPVFEQSPEDRKRTWAAYGAFDARDRLHEISAPTLVLMSSGDRMVDVDDCFALWRGIPNSTIVGLDGIGHDWLTEAPALGAAVVSAFLRGQLDRDGNHSAHSKGLSR